MSPDYSITSTRKAFKPTIPIAEAEKWGTIGRAFMIIIVSLFVYASGMSGAFLFDDITNIVESEVVKGPIVSSFQSTRPLTLASFCINYHLTGMSVFGFHSFNNAVHAIASVVFYLVLVVTFSKRHFGNFNIHWAAFAIALVWSVHPLNTQAVTYIVQRAESLTGLFFFTFLFCLAKSDGSSKPAVWLSAAFVALCLGLGCKQVMLMVMPVGLLYDRVFLSGSFTTTFKARRSFWLINFALVVIGALYVLPNVTGSVGGVGFRLTNVNFVEYLTTQPKVILYYARLLVFPSPLILDYGWSPERRTAVLVATTVVCFVIAVLSTINLHKNSHWGFWPLAALLVLAPTSSVIPLIDLIVEHRMYTPAAFIIAMLGILAIQLSEHALGKHSTTTLIVGCSTVVVILATLTWQRNYAYRTPLAMWEDVVNKAPNNWRGYFNLGCELEKVSPERSFGMYEKAIELNPNFAGSLSNLAHLQLQQGRTMESIANLRRAIELDDKFADAYINLGLAMKASGDETAAFNLFRHALQIDPKSSKGHYNLGTLFAKINTELAVKHLRTAIQLDPDFSQSHNNLAAIIEEQDPQGAVFHYREAIRVDATNAQAKRNLESLLSKSAH